MAGFNHYIERCYYGPEGTAQLTAASNLSLEKDASFAKYLKIDLTKDTVEIPCVYMCRIMDALAYAYSTGKDYKQLYIPLMYLLKDNVEARTSNSLLRAFFYESFSQRALYRKLCNDVVYLGGKGIILYEDFTPLIMFTLEIKKIEDENKYQPIRKIVRINPCVYNKSDTIAKYIRSKFIANLIDCSTSFPTSNVNNPSNIFIPAWVSRRFKIIVEDFSDFFCAPVVPDATFSDEKVNKLLSDNLDDIIENI